MMGVEMAPPFQTLVTCTGVFGPFWSMGPATVLSLMTSCETRYR